MTEVKFSRSAILGDASKVLSCDEARESDYLLIDVRSSDEYHSGTIPGAVNIPLFDEDERSVVGTIYKHAGKPQAIEQGFQYAEEKMNKLLGGFERYGDRPFAIFCARGGMRSRSIVNLLNETGHTAVQVEGGYKDFRTGVLQGLEHFSQPLIVIHGLTGTGKTRILQHLDNMIDLEGLAMHRGSLFGGLDLNPRNQRDFEALLADQIATAGTPPFFVEGESRKIGRVFIPKAFSVAMKSAKLVYVSASIETRIERILEEYPVETLDQQMEVEAILRSLTQNIGEEKVEVLCSLLHEKRLSELVRILLVEYYDKRYARCMKNYEYDLELSSENIEQCAARLTEFRQSLL